MNSDGENKSGITGKMEIQALGEPAHSTRSGKLPNLGYFEIHMDNHNDILFSFHFILTFSARKPSFAAL